MELKLLLLLILLDLGHGSVSRLNHEETKEMGVLIECTKYSR